MGETMGGGGHWKETVCAVSRPSQPLLAAGNFRIQPVETSTNLLGNLD